MLAQLDSAAQRERDAARQARYLVITPRAQRERDAARQAES